MNETLRYKDFIGSIEVSLEDACLHGKLLFINDLVTYEATTLKQLQKEFEHSVNDYLVTCKNLNRKPQKPYKGSLNVRIGSDLHKQIALQAVLMGISINDYIKKAIQNYTTTKSSAKPSMP